MLEPPFETPVQKINLPSFTKNGVEVYMKRDDMIHPFVSGNKWRKLRYVLADARSLNKDHLVSFGGAYSNHLVALACAGAMYRFKTSAFVRGEEVSNPMLSLCRLYGMNLAFVSRDAYKNKELLYQEFASSNPSAYFIDEGGKSTLAARGCEEILHAVEPGYFSHVVCPVGTGTTLAGVARAASEKKLLAEGVCVLKGAEDMNREIALIAGFDVMVHHRFHRGGYAKTDHELLHFIRNFAGQTGILLDQVYTAKMMMGIEQLILEEHYPQGSRILAIHTGGLMGMLSIL